MIAVYDPHRGTATPPFRREATGPHLVPVTLVMAGGIAPMRKVA